MEKMKNTAIENIEKLISKLGLNPNVKKYFEEGKIYYSYLAAGGWIGSIDELEYDKRYHQIVAECEKTLTKALSRGVKIVRGKRKGRVELEFYDDDDLQRLYEALEGLKV